MLKKFYLLLLVLAAGCQSGVMDYETCPRVQIIRDNAYLTQVVNYREEFQINLIGYDGYCYMDRKINQNKALIKPIFQIKRLRPSDETDVHFAFYTETVKGPPQYIGKKTHFAVATIPARRAGNRIYRAAGDGLCSRRIQIQLRYQYGFGDFARRAKI